MLSLGDRTEQLCHSFELHVAVLQLPLMFCSSSTAPISRMIEASLGNMPTTSARRLTSLFKRSSGFVSGMPLLASVVSAVRHARSLRATGTGEPGARKVGRPLSSDEL